MSAQERNPLNFYCPPNGATPDYVAYRDFRSWCAYGLLLCWLGDDADSPDAGVNATPPVTLDDVTSLRRAFLDVVENVIALFWAGEVGPGEGDLDVPVDSSVEIRVNAKTLDLSWRARLDEDCLMLELSAGGDGRAIWLEYAALRDRSAVAQALRECAAVVGGTVFPNLLNLAGEIA